MNAALVMAGVLAFVAVGIVGAGPAAGIHGTPPAACTLKVALNMPATVLSGGPVPISAVASSQAGCRLTVTNFAFNGLPGVTGIYDSSTGFVLASTAVAGTYAISVVATTSMGTAGVGGTLFVQ